MEMQAKTIYNQILSLFQESMSIKEIAHELKVSEVKVRRVLITEGYWSSPTSEEIMDLHCAGFNPNQIASQLKKSLKTVQAYLPYTRGEYGDGDLSDSAQQSKDFRQRKRDARERLVGVGRKDKVMEDKRNEINFSGVGNRVLKLHLELIMDLDNEDETILRKFGKSEKGISRDILVSDKMLLHNLHYAIQRAFGWQNSHLHHFSYPEDVFNTLVEDKFSKLLDLCGIYYRYPKENDEDLFWDDDYDESVSFKTWLKRKYSAPYFYGGLSEYYLSAQTEAKRLRRQKPELKIVPSFSEFLEGKKEGKVKNLNDVTVGDIRIYFLNCVDELLERLPLGQVIGLKVTDGWRDKVEEIISVADSSFSDNHNQLSNWENVDCTVESFLKKTSPEVIPLSDTLIYSYDYGDDWEVMITCNEVYDSFDGWNKETPTGFVKPPMTEQQVFDDQTPFDSKGRQVEGEIRDQIATVLTKGKPVCISADGLPVMDDVGGPHGYCTLLNKIHGLDCGDDYYPDKNWARSMGWTGRMSKPKNIL